MTEVIVMVVKHNGSLTQWKTKLCGATNAEEFTLQERKIYCDEVYLTKVTIQITGKWRGLCY